MNTQQLRSALDDLETASIDIATGEGDGQTVRQWEEARDKLIKEPQLKQYIPTWLVTCRDTGAFWDYLKEVHTGAGAYSARRQHIRESLLKLCLFVEWTDDTPLDEAIEAITTETTAETIREAWGKISARRHTDPEGSITASRSMLESVCKHILEENGTAYTENENLPKLYKMVAKELRLAPEQYQEEIFKQILGGCASVVGGLAAVRNKLGDAHGKRRRTVRPNTRHANLAINLAGTISVFLIQTHEDGKLGYRKEV